MNKKILALLLAALLIPLGNTFLVQLDTFATVTMRELRSRDDIELALVGSSIVQHHFNAPLISEQTGLTAFDVTITNAYLPDDLALTRQLYDLAELSRQPLQAEQMTEFIRRSMDIVELAAQM